MSALRELLATFHIGVEDKELDKAHEKIGDFIGKLKEVGESIAAAFAVEQVVEFVKSQAEAATELERTAVRLGTTTDELQAMNLAAQESGVSADALSNGLRFLNLHIAEAAKGGGQAAALFKEAGVSITDAAGKSRPAGDVMADLADHIASIDEPAKQTQLAMRLLGRGGVELIPLLKQGGAAFDEARQKVSELGGGITEDFIGQAKKAEEATADMNFALTSLKTKVASEVLPIFTQIVRVITRMVVEFSRAVGGTNGLKIAMGGLAAALAAAAPLPTVMAVAFVLMFAAAYELVRLFEGKESLIGNMLGPDKKAFVDTMREAVNDLTTAFGGLTGDADGSTSAMMVFANAVLAVAKALAWVVELVDAVGNGLEKLAAPIADVFTGNIGRAGADLKDIGKAGRKNREAYDRDEARPQLDIDSRFAAASAKVDAGNVNLEALRKQIAARRQMREYAKGTFVGPPSLDQLKNATASAPQGIQPSTPISLLRPGEQGGFFRPPGGGLGGPGVGGDHIEVTQTNTTNVEVHGVPTDQATPVGDAVGAGVSNSQQRANDRAITKYQRP